ncbi:MAG: imidazole glycerol phosphate synthase subunit HisH [Gemmatimonadota bacterium]|nr:imidazole glycerol phosphate synthase subunit HisH [Gemmatimonadota bacterium]HEU4988885.1 imidazole glycerol phosphate synthase subunit HisH [Gemmatimonadaceae bacterium]
MRVTVFDYGAGNLHSLMKALETPEWTVAVETDPAAAAATDVLVLPGVGAFASAVQRLAPGAHAVRRALDDGLPCIGICLGMQLLFEESDEGPGAGLGFFAGRVRRIRADRVPQIGWNQLVEVSDPVIEHSGLRDVYYANSFVCAPVDSGIVTAWSEHDGDRFPAAARAGSVLGVQFHPEKSSHPGVRMLHEFLRSVRP